MPYPIIFTNRIRQIEKHFLILVSPRNSEEESLWGCFWTPISFGLHRPKISVYYYAFRIYSSLFGQKCPWERKNGALKSKTSKILGTTENMSIWEKFWARLLSRIFDTQKMKFGKFFRLLTFSGVMMGEFWFLKPFEVLFSTFPVESLYMV